MESSPRVLHLAGAHASSFYHDLSLIYARDAFLPSTMNHDFAVVQPDGGWRLGPTLDTLSPPMALDRMLSELGSIDLVVPYMFDPLGMTSYRSFFEDLLGAPVVGSRAEVTALATDKALSKSIAAGEGIPVPHSYDLSNDDLEFPVIVKPNTEDNSRGLTLVSRPEALTTAIAEATALDAGVLVEQYIPGREIRVAVVELGSELYVPAMIEYAVSERHPIREVTHKLDVGADGNPVSQTTSDQVASICPADVADDLRLNLEDLARRAHHALGCRDYSLFDFRVDTTNRPYLLEAGLFWTFGHPSMITRMIAADGRDSEAVAETVWRAAMDRKRHTAAV